MTRGKELRKMLSNGQVFAPCVWDCVSAKAAQMAGFNAILLSGGTYASFCCGFPDIGLFTQDDLVRQSELICDYVDIPVIVDADEGYGESAVTTYRLAKRLARVGAAAFTIEDSTGIKGYNRWSYFIANSLADGTVEHPVVSQDSWLSKLKAGLDATSGTDCMLIARTEAKIGYGVEEAIERACKAQELGVEMVLVMGMLTQEDAEKVAKYVKGWKMWPDVQSHNGVPDVIIKNIETLGYNLVTTHIFERACLASMVDVGRHVKDSEQTVYADNYSIAGMDKKVGAAFSKVDPWLEKEAGWIREAKLISENRRK